MGHDTGLFKAILVPVDFSPCSNEAFRVQILAGVLLPLVVRLLALPSLQRRTTAITRCHVIPPSAAESRAIAGR